MAQALVRSQQLLLQAFQESGTFVKSGIPISVSDPAIIRLSINAPRTIFSSHDAVFDAPAATSKVIPEVLLPPLTEFTWFKKLPVELRLAIWKEAISADELRVMKLALSFSDVTSTNGLGKILFRTVSGRDFYVSNYKVPAAVMVNKEARVAAMKRYTLCEGEGLRDAKIWIDVAQDILHFGCLALEKLTLQHGNYWHPRWAFAIGVIEQKVESIVVQFDTTTDTLELLYGVLPRFQALKKVLIVRFRYTTVAEADFVRGLCEKLEESAKSRGVDMGTFSLPEIRWNSYSGSIEEYSYRPPISA